MLFASKGARVIMAVLPFIIFKAIRYLIFYTLHHKDL